MIRRVLVAEPADLQIQGIETWWQRNRPASPELFAREFAWAVDFLSACPTMGTPIRANPKEIRRVYLKKTRYHIYYRLDHAAQVVEIRAVWHTARGTSPKV